VLGNDLDCDGNPLSKLFVTIPAHGALRLNANVSFNLSPGHELTTGWPFTYKATDGTQRAGGDGDESPITNVTHSPVALNDAYTMAETRC